MTNEEIHLNENEGLEIDIYRITYNDGNAIGRPTSHKITLPYKDIKCFLKDDTISEEILESIVVGMVRHEKPNIKSFRWLWDRYRLVDVSKWS